MRIRNAGWIGITAVAALVGGMFGVGVAQAGQYQIDVSRKASNLYEIRGQNYFIETSLCLELAIGQPARLDTMRFGSTTGGTLTFQKSYGAPAVCSVRGVYEEQSFDGRAIDRFGNIVEVKSLLIPVTLN